MTSPSRRSSTRSRALPPDRQGRDDPEGVDQLRLCDEMVSKLGLFSSNETKDDVVSTTNLNYPLVGQDDRILILKQELILLWHLLTTSWSSLISKKKLASGDAVMFLRSVFFSHTDGELRLGVRREVQFKNVALLEAGSNIGSKLQTLSSVASSSDNRGIFLCLFQPK
ncbi:hypothetical protein EJB05_06361, partial [Eragrostis curvula]